MESGVIVLSTYNVSAVCGFVLIKGNVKPFHPVNLDLKFPMNNNIIQCQNDNNSLSVSHLLENHVNIIFTNAHFNSKPSCTDVQLL